MLNAEQRNTFETLLADKDFKGKKSLKYLLWLNTTSPKYNKGDCFLVTDPGHSVFGHPVKDFRGKIIEVWSWKDCEEYHYKLEGVVKCDNGKEAVVNYIASERDLITRCEDNVTYLGTPNSEHVEELSV